MFQNLGYELSPKRYVASAMFIAFSNLVTHVRIP